MFKITEHATGFQRWPDFSVQLSLSVMIQVMDSKTRHHRIELPEVRKRIGKIMPNSPCLKPKFVWF